MDCFYCLPQPIKDYLVSAFKWLANGEKVNYGHDLSKPVTPFAEPLTHAYTLKNTVIKINGVLYLLGHGREAILGQGSYATVYAGQALLTDALVAVKVEAGRNEFQTAERAILNDLDLCLGSAYDHSAQQHYLVLPHLGSPLDNYLRTHRLTIEQRFQYAIQLCWQLAKLHSGLASLSQTAYSHRDIKPANIAIDQHGHIQLLDFGSSQASPEEKTADALGSPAYMGSSIRFGKASGLLSHKQHDMLALKRTLFMPNSVAYIYGYRNDPKGKHFSHPMLLTKGLLELYQLSSYIDTGCTNQSIYDDKADSTLDATTLASILVVAKLHFPKKTYELLERSKALSFAIIGHYLNFEQLPAKLQKHKIEALLKLYHANKTVIEEYGLLVQSGLTAQLEKAVKHRPLIQCLKNLPSLKERVAVINLFKLNLATADNLQRFEHALALRELICQCVRQKKVDQVKQLLSSTNHEIAQKLLSIDAIEQMLQVLDDPPLKQAIKKCATSTQVRALLLVKAYVKVMPERFYAQIYWRANSAAVITTLFLNRTKQHQFIEPVLYENHAPTVKKIVEVSHLHYPKYRLERIMRHLSEVLKRKALLKTLQAVNLPDPIFTLLSLALIGMDDWQVFMLSQNSIKLSVLCYLLTHEQFSEQDILLVANDHSLCHQLFDSLENKNSIVELKALIQLSTGSKATKNPQLPPLFPHTYPDTFFKLPRATQSLISGQKEPTTDMAVRV